MSTTKEQLETSVKAIGEGLEDIVAGRRWRWQEEYNSDTILYTARQMIEEVIEELGWTKFRKLADVGKSFKNAADLLKNVCDTEIDCFVESLQDHDIIMKADVSDYFKYVYDIEFRIDRQGELRSVKVAVVIGGPGIFVDSGSETVEGYWGFGSDRSTYPLGYRVKEAIDEWGAEQYRLTKEGCYAYH